MTEFSESDAANEPMRLEIQGAKIVEEARAQADRLPESL
jgi:hypothetical protein